MDDHDVTAPPKDHEAALEQIREKLRGVERRDWWLWATAVTVLLLITSALFVVELPELAREQDIFPTHEMDVAVRGLFGLVLLFSVFAIYQQHLIKQLRARMAAQIGVMAALQTRAEVFEKLAILDPLTGLFNRRFATEHLPAEISRAERFGYPFTLMMLDLNGFKQINDVHGHAAGDLALREFAHALKKCVRSSDLPVRVGGDEFMVLLPECREYAVPHALARLRDLAIHFNNSRIPLTFAAGWAEYQPNESPEQLMQRADRALYTDKRTGRAAQKVQQAEADERQEQKMQVVGQMTGRVVHDFNNLLTVIKGYSELVLNSLGAADPNRLRVDDIRKAAAHAAQLTNQLLAFTRKQQSHPKVVDLNQHVADMESLLRPLLGERVQMEIRLGADSGAIRVQAGYIEQILMNLITNARDAISGPGLIVIETENATLDASFTASHPGSRAGDYVKLAVSDTGSGMVPEVRDRIFEPFFTTKPGGKGTGLGLSTVYGTVKQVGGYIDVSTETGRGSCFTVYFPRFVEMEAPAAAESETPEQRHANPGGRATVLVVESLDALRSLTCEFLKSEGFDYLTARGAAEAVQVAAEYPGQIHVAITDLLLPGMSCREMAAMLQARRPGMKMLYVTGYSDMAIPYSDLADSGSFLETPFSPEDLSRKIREMLADANATVPATV